MQFLESSVIGLRSAVTELGSQKVSPQFLIIPMIHIGDPSFYEDVSRRLDECQTIIFEGVPGFRARLIKQAYRITVKRRSLGLVLQSDTIRMSRFKARKIHGDITSEGFAANLRSLPWLQQIGLLILAPIYGCWTYLVASRDSLARGNSKDSLSNTYAHPESDSVANIRDVILTKRDEVIVSCIDNYIRNCEDKNETAAILFGAGHMPAIVSHLRDKHGYSPKKSEWVSVIATTW